MILWQLVINKTVALIAMLQRNVKEINPSQKRPSKQLRTHIKHKRNKMLSYIEYKTKHSQGLRAPYKQESKCIVAIEQRISREKK